MPTWVALFRGINVGGRNRLPMAELRDSLAQAGMLQVRTYIQSGNVIFGSQLRSKKTLSIAIADRVEQDFGFRPQVLVIRPAQLSHAIEANPLLDRSQVEQANGSHYHIYFLDGKPKQPDQQRLESKAKPSERFAIAEDLFFLHAPEGVARSKLAASVESCLGIPTTARNLNTVRALLAMHGGDK